MIVIIKNKSEIVLQVYFLNAFLEMPEKTFGGRVNTCLFKQKTMTVRCAITVVLACVRPQAI